MKPPDFRHVHLSILAPWATEAQTFTLDVKAGELVCIQEMDHPELGRVMAPVDILKSRDLAEKVDRPFLLLQPALRAKLLEALQNWDEQFTRDRSMYDVADRIKEALAMLGNE